MADKVDDGKALFRGFFAAELSAWLQKRNAGRINELKRADWELRRNTRFQPGLRSNDDMTALPPLSEAERAERVAIVDQLRRNTLRIRAVAWVLGCGFCQAMWAAADCYTITSPDWGQLESTCLAYAAIAFRLCEKLAMGTTSPVAKTQHQPCGG